MGYARLGEAWPRIDGFHMGLYERMSGSTLLPEGAGDEHNGGSRLPIVSLDG